MFAGESGDVCGDFGGIRDLVRNEPGAIAVFETDFGAPQNVARQSRMAVDLVDDAIELGPGEAVAVVPGEAVFGEFPDGTRLAAANEPEHDGEHQDRKRGPDHAIEAEAVVQMNDWSKK